MVKNKSLDKFFLIIIWHNFAAAVVVFSKLFFVSDSTFSGGGHASILKIFFFGNHFRIRTTVGHEFIPLFDPCDHT